MFDPSFIFLARSLNSKYLFAGQSPQGSGCSASVFSLHGLPLSTVWSPRHYPIPNNSASRFSQFRGWHPSKHSSLSVMSIFSKFHVFFNLSPFTCLLTHVASWNSIYRIRHLRSGKIGLIIDAESKIYFKPNKINEARMKLLFGI